jgi:hypothetical protein
LTVTLTTGLALGSNGRRGSAARPWSTTVEFGQALFRSAPDGIYPGGGTETIPFAVTNTGQGARRLDRVTFSVVSDAATGDVETAAGRDVRGCLSAWFRLRPASGTHLGPDVTLGAGETYRGAMRLSMINAPVNQDACQGQAPAVAVSGA